MSHRRHAFARSSVSGPELAGLTALSLLVGSAAFAVPAASRNPVFSLEVVSRTPLEQGNGASSYEDEDGGKRVSADGRVVALFQSGDQPRPR
ncbi:MAG: hypothetical protein SGJ09_11975 [Phycisphaerae bacterium]|nr:hypothetical protein [Phycisphaerae bacterium]